MMTGLIGRKVTLHRERLKRIPDCWLSLAAAPTFTIMALLTALGGGQPDVLCAARQHALPFSGMVPMYLLMGIFHSPPWLKLFCGR
jgi:hypothetical protein